MTRSSGQAPSVAGPAGGVSRCQVGSGPVSAPPGGPAPRREEVSAVGGGPEIRADMATLDCVRSLTPASRRRAERGGRSGVPLQDRSCRVEEFRDAI